MKDKLYLIGIIFFFNKKSRYLHAEIFKLLFLAFNIFFRRIPCKKIDLANIGLYKFFLITDEKLLFKILYGI